MNSKGKQTIEATNLDLTSMTLAVYQNFNTFKFLNYK